MKKQLIAGLILVSLGLSGQAQALEVGKGSPYDYRIKSVVYNPVDVVRIDSVAGVATHIVVAPDESYVTHAFGDSNSYAFTHVENNMFIKPKGEVPSDTNLVLVTNKRTYNIVLHYVGDYTTKDAQGNVKANFIKTPWSMKNATLQLTYLYPFEDMKKANKTLESNRVKKALKDLQNGPYNLLYKMSDEDEYRTVAPVNVWDNFRFTYFKFPANADLPVVFYIGDDGKEHTVNQHPAGEYNNIVVAETVAKEWRIRYGNKVVGVLNMNYNPNLGAISTGTTSPDVKRVKKGEGDKS
ncbi:conjugal transfer protein TraO [Salmonella enterica subsp. enterica serovar Panama]|nr:conjugal transfer protein TraO [Salmonella enterica]EEC1370534.1 conjugal transfer protein TraO [Salmonella enterica subsp. enterica serovar Panama]EEJ8966938.1 conjugal transfer protein TraO [Salmonella enterica subsp. enterica serovar 4,[5],12:i:-]ELS0358177.1 TrbG/VirB9 family P-type conjugative transfer protein [Escherichia coli]HEB5381177.1 TrbG/VirB9 family P-type conjugative transfer protein [Klebsiella pneumoniae]